VFSAYAGDFDDGLFELEATSISDFTTQTQGIIVNVTSDSPLWCIGGCVTAQNTGNKIITRLQLDNADVLSTITTDTYARQSWDTNDNTPIMHQGVMDVLAGAHVLELDGSILTPNTGRGLYGNYTLAVQLATPTVGANDPPVWDTIPELGQSNSITINEGETVTFLVNAVDPESDPLTYSLVQLGVIEGAQFDSSEKRFTWTPTNAQAGTWDFTLQVTDGASIVNKAFQIIVVDVPTPITFTDLRNLRFDAAVQGGRIDVVVVWSGAGNALKQQGITGIEVDYTDTGRI
jgi:hypothetical protein